LRKVEIEIVGNGRPDKRPGVTSVFPDQAVKKKDAKGDIFQTEPLHGLDDLADPFSFFVDPAVAQDLEVPEGGRSAGEGLDIRPRRRLRTARVGLFQRVEYIRVDPPRGPETAHFVFPLDPPAHAFRAPEIVEAAPGDLLFFLVALEDKVKEFGPGPEALKLGQDRILAAKADLELLFRDRLEGPDLSSELQPVRRFAFRGEKDDAVASPDQRVPGFYVTPDPSVDLDVGKERRNVHSRNERSMGGPTRQGQAGFGIYQPVYFLYNGTKFAMIELSLVYPYYNNAPCLERQLRLWTGLPQELARRIEYVLVDDGSPEPAKVALDLPINLTLVRIKKDIPWNQPGARNLGLKLAEGEWVLPSDIDHLFLQDGLSRVLSMAKDPGAVYYFGRKCEDGSARHPHPNTFLVHRETFWKTGGYDEDFCGHYGKDDILLHLQFERSYRVVPSAEPVLIELDQGATPGLKRSSRHNRRLFKKKGRLLERGKYRNGRTLRFEWEIVRRWRMEPCQGLGY